MHVESQQPIDPGAITATPAEAPPARAGQSTPAATPGGVGPLRWMIIVCLIVVGGALAGGLFKLKFHKKSTEKPWFVDPRVTYDGPYLNVRPDVKYVGTAVCAECHKNELEGFHHHPMGRSVLSTEELQREDPVE